MEGKSDGTALCDGVVDGAALPVGGGVPVGVADGLRLTVSFERYSIKFGDPDRKLIKVPFTARACSSDLISLKPLNPSSINVATAPATNGAD